MTNTQSMLLVKGTISWEGKKKATFKLIPLTSDCPYMEVLYHPVYLGLGIVGKFKKESYEMVPALDKDGNFVPKKKKIEPGEFPYRQERRLIEAWNEYEILTKEEIVSFIKLVAVNAETFDIEPFFVKAEEASNNLVEVKTEVKADVKVEMKATVTEKPVTAEV